MEDLEKERDLYMAFEAGRESVIANRETYQKVRAEGVREGMESVLTILEEIKTGSSFPRVLENAIEAIREEIDNE